MALPRPRISPQVVGAVIGAIALGGLFVSMGIKAGDDRPEFYFYLFSAIALGSALRVISHPRPVYAALYFILTILASSALYLVLEAEFMAFALIIIYAGAILITYLFVIMLAEQAPTGEEVGALSEYDRYSREPALATGVGFVLLALLTVMLTRGLGDDTIVPQPSRTHGAALLAELPKKVLGSLDRIGAMDGIETPELAAVGSLLSADGGSIRLTVTDAMKFAKSLERSDVAELVGGRESAQALASAVTTGQTVRLALPASLHEENIDGIGFALIAAHPMALELAGVILLMAMLGAVVLARKQIEIAEEAKAQAAIGGGG